MLCNISEDQRLDLHILVSSWYDALGLSVYIGLHGQHRCRKQPLPDHQQLSTNSRVIITRTVEALLYISHNADKICHLSVSNNSGSNVMHSWLYPQDSINDLNQWHINYLHFPFHVCYCLQNQISTKAI